jgi:hypothetical protein
VSSAASAIAGSRTLDSSAASTAASAASIAPRRCCRRLPCRGSCARCTSTRAAALAAGPTPRAMPETT